MTEVQAPAIDVAVAQAATRDALKPKLPDEQVEHFINATTGQAPGLGVPAPITCNGSLYFAVLYGVVHCQPTDPATYPWTFDQDSWGIGVSAGSGAGLLYTAYDSWDAFFRNTAGYHAQGIAEGGGILQINFFNSDAVPIGQYNGVAGGIGVFECGNSGTWRHL